MLYRTLCAPISVQIELTTRCSNKCLHCYNYQRQDDDPDISMTIEQLRHTMNAIKKAGVFSVTFTGGEPLLETDLVIEGISLCSQLGMPCSINTNLVVTSERLIAKMLDAGKFNILTSLASYDQRTHDLMMGRHGAFERTIKGIELLSRSKIKFFVNMVITSLNANHVYDTGYLAHTLGAKAFSATKATPPLGCSDFSSIRPTKEQVKISLDNLLHLQSDTNMQIDILECYPLCFFEDVRKYEVFARHNCTAGTTSATISPDGQVRACSHSNRLYGNILEEDMTTIYEHMGEWRSGELLPAICLSCEHFPRCTGGCRCESEYEGGVNYMDPYSSTPSAVTTLPDQVKSDIEILPTTTVSINPNVVLRKENFGYLMWTATSNVALVGEEAGQLMYLLQESEMNFAKVLEVIHSEKDKVVNVLCYLANKRMINLG